RWIRKPPVHFVVSGAILFAIGHRRGAPPRPADRPTLVITATRLAQVRAELGAVTASAPAPDERTLVERAVDDEILYREALARGMDHKDPSVRWRLAEKMRFLGDEETTATPGSEDELYRKAVRLGLDREDAIVRGILVRQMRLLLARVAGEKPPDDAELAGYLERHPDRYVEPGRVTFWHVFLADDRRRAGVTRVSQRRFAISGRSTSCESNRPGKGADESTRRSPDDGRARARPLPRKCGGACALSRAPRDRGARR